MPNTEKINRFQTRIPQHIMEKLNMAASLTGSSLNQFMVQAALEKAQALIEKESVLNISERDANMIFDSIENPPQPSDALIAAALDYKKKFPND